MRRDRSVPSEESEGIQQHQLVPGRVLSRTEPEHVACNIETFRHPPERHRRKRGRDTGLES